MTILTDIGMGPRKHMHECDAAFDWISSIYARTDAVRADYIQLDSEERSMRALLMLETIALTTGR
jgi:hypothetical protein